MIFNFELIKLLGLAYDTRKGTNAPLDPDVDKALSKAIDLQLKMHENLGKELHSIGWDVMVHVQESKLFSNIRCFLFEMFLCFNIEDFFGENNVNKNNVNNLAKSIIKILKNNKYKHDKIVRYYKTNFSPSVVTRKIEKLYSS